MQWESDIKCVCETAEMKGVNELSEDTINTLKRLMIEVNTQTRAHTHFIHFPFAMYPLVCVAMVTG